MGKIGDALQSLLPFLKRKKNEDDWEKDPKKRNGDDDDDDEEEEEEDKPIGAVSMNEGKHEKIFGIRREVVKGIGAFFATVLLAALILAPGNDSENQAAKGDGFPQADEKDIAAQKKKDQKNATNDYASLIESNRRKEAEAKSNEQSPPSQQTSKPKQEVAPVAASPPVIPRATATPTVVPVQQQATAPVPVPQPPQPEPQETKDGRYTSGISFGGSGIGQQASSAGGSGAPSSSGNGDGGAESVIPVMPVQAVPTEITPRSLAIGTIIPVSLMTGINTDSPGQVMAMVLSDVTDSLTGNIVLIPAGSKLFGTLGGSQGSAGTGRVSLTFSTVLTPDNRSFNVGNAFQAIDGAGYSGVKGKVHKHTAQRFSSGLLAAGISALGSMAAGNTNGNSNTYSAGQLAAQGALASLINQTSGLLQSNANIGPTTTVKPGYEFSIYVAQNIQF